MLSKWGEVEKFINKIFNKMKYPQFTTDHSKKKDMLVMGAKYQNQITKQTDAKKQKNEYRKRDVEKYFRPSCLSILNSRVMDFQFFNPYYDKSYDEIVLSPSLMNSPENTIINYFSILREAKNLTSNQIGGCGTVGMAKLNRKQMTSSLML